MIYRFSSILLALVAILYMPVFPEGNRAAPAIVQFNHYTINEGLSQNNVTAILQDRYGYLWIATLDGLNKYDGYSFSPFKYIPSDTNSLSSSSISTLYEDKNGNLWVGTFSAGLNKINLITNRVTRYRAEDGVPYSLGDDRIRALLIDQQGYLWIGTKEDGLNLFDPRNNRFLTIESEGKAGFGLADSHIRSLFEDSGGNIWIGTATRGLYVLIASEVSQALTGNARFLRVVLNPEDGGKDRIESVIEDRHQNMWVAVFGKGVFKISSPRFLEELNIEEVSDGLLHLNEFSIASSWLRANDISPQKLNSNFVETIFEDHQGLIWIGTADAGVSRYSPSSGKFIHFSNQSVNPKSLSYDNVETIFEDRSRNLWIGTWGGGLNKLDLKPAKFRHYQHDPHNIHSISANYVRTIAEDSLGFLWIGSTEGGLDRLDRETSTIWHVRNEKGDLSSLSNDDVRVIYFDRQGTLWVGTYGGGLNRLISPLPGRRNASDLQLRFKRYKKQQDYPGGISSNYIWCIEETEDGSLWVGTNEGLNQLDPKTGKFRHYKHDPRNPNSLSHDIVRTIFRDKGGILWIGTYRGLNRFDPVQKQFIRFTQVDGDTSGLSHNSIISIHQDKDGIFWLGTLGGGLIRFDPDRKKFRTFTEADGLANNFVHAILEDAQGNLWLSTNQGISKMMREGNRYRFRNFDVSDGLQSMEFNAGAAFRNKRGEMFLGGVNGFNEFHPQQVIENPFPPPVIITAFKIFNKNKEFRPAYLNRRNIRLSHRDNFFSFEFAALDFTVPGRNQYAYKMEGFDADWIYIGNRRHASYTNLDPGTYTFRVKAANPDGLWNESGTAIQLVIVPPFWQTWKFRLLLMAIVGLLIGWIYTVKINRLQKEKDAQEAFSRKLIKVQEQERKRLASELHDSLGQNMLIANNLLQQRMNHLTDKQALNNSLQEISAIVRQSIDEIREVSAYLHPHQLERLGLKKTIAGMLQRMSATRQIDVETEMDDLESIFNQEVEINIYRMIQEGMNNVVKHSGAQRVRLQIKKREKNIKILLADDGKGFDLSDMRNKTALNGFGLISMMERVKLIGGVFKIETAPGKGTRLHFTIPLLEKNKRNIV